MLPWVQLHNFYGASESSCTVYTVLSDGVDLTIFPSKAPAGHPQPHAEVYVMRKEQHNGQTRFVRQVAGQSGETCFEGMLAAYYWKHDELTAQKWVRTPWGLLYRSGDLGRWKAGQLEIVRRTDRQVKVRGVRIEPEEVEAVLKKYQYAVPDPEAPAETSGAATMRAVLKDVSVVASAEPSDLVAFATLRDGVSDKMVTPENLHKHCQTTDLSPLLHSQVFRRDEQGRVPQAPQRQAQFEGVDG